MEEISLRAGVTKATVSNILKGRFKASRSDAARRATRVRQIALDMGYRFNRAASATKTGRTGCIGMLMSHAAQYSVRVEAFEKGVAEALEERNLLLLSGLLNPKLVEKPTYLPRIISESLADGLLINYAYRIPPAIEKMISEHNRAAIWINSKHPANCVYPDDAGACRAAVKYLVEHGHRKIAFGSAAFKSDPGSSHYSDVDRLEGYVRGMRESGLRARVIESRAALPDEDYKGHLLRNAHDLLDRLKDSTALIHNASTPVMMTAAAEREIRIPEDLSLICFQNNESESFEFEVTRLLVPFFEMGVQAVGLLCEKIDNGNQSVRAVSLPYGVTPGPTVRNLS